MEKILNKLADFFGYEYEVFEYDSIFGKRVDNTRYVFYAIVCNTKYEKFTIDISDCTVRFFENTLDMDDLQAILKCLKELKKNDIQRV